MKIGLGLYFHSLTTDNFRFAKQAGATHIVAHIIDYQSEFPRRMHTGGVGDREKPWTEEALRGLKAAINAEGLELEAIENIEPSLWYDVVLDGPRKKEQLENLKELIRRLGRVGIPILGYNFSIAGVWGHVIGGYARGGAESVAFLGKDGPEETPVPNGVIWNLCIPEDRKLPPGFNNTTSEELWQRLADFLKAIVPVAEECGVRLAAHPDDPPMPTIRGTGRLVYQPYMYQRLLDIIPSRSNALEFCMGSIQEMTEGSVYDALDQYSRQKAIAYIHFRNICGKVPRYHEVFLDEGDIDMVRALRVLRANKYDGVLIPDHTPQMTCGAPWHAGVAYALGWMRAAMHMMERGTG